MKIYTKTGDAGDTGLFGGGRVPKDDPRVEAYGDVDELNAVLGMARAVEAMPRIDEVLVPVQRDLFAIGALLATPDRDKMAQHLEKARIDEARIAELERAIDDARRGARAAACVHPARRLAQGRRAARRAHGLPSRRAPRRARSSATVEIPALVVIYLNRLSDLLFTLARLANQRAGAGEVTW